VECRNDITSSVVRLKASFTAQFCWFDAALLQQQQQQHLVVSSKNSYTTNADQE
jgi:hypothetical protein